MRAAVQALIRHDQETWRAVLGEPLSGNDDRGGRLTSNAVVLEILPDARTIRTHGGSDWHGVAQVHEIYDIDWVDGERFVWITLESSVESEAAERREAGWTLLADNPLPGRSAARVLVFGREPAAPDGSSATPL